jgi:RimJ/RimL family protein N-acetyltransferase
MLRLQGDRILLRDFRPYDRDPLLALESDEAMFTYMKFRVDRDPAESLLLPRLLEEPGLDPRLRYNLVVEDAEGFCGWAGIDRIEGVDSGQFGWYLRSDRWGGGTPPKLLGSCSTSDSPFCTEPRCRQLLTQKIWHPSRYLRSQASPTEA